MCCMATMLGGVDLIEDTIAKIGIIKDRLTAIGLSCEPMAYYENLFTSTTVINFRLRAKAQIITEMLLCDDLRKSIGHYVCALHIVDNVDVSIGSPKAFANWVVALARQTTPKGLSCF